MTKAVVTTFGNCFCQSSTILLCKIDIKDFIRNYVNIFCLIFIKTAFMGETVNFRGKLHQYFFVENFLTINYILTFFI